MANVRTDATGDVKERDAPKLCKERRRKKPSGAVKPREDVPGIV